MLRLGHDTFQRRRPVRARDWRAVCQNLAERSLRGDLASGGLGSNVRQETDESAPTCEPRGLIHSQECGSRSLAAPQVPNMLAQSTRLRPTASALRADTSYPLTMSGDRPVSIYPIGVGQGFLAMPFDALRVQYASAVMAGLVQRSILASGRLERALDALEKLILGQLARQR